MLQLLLVRWLLLCRSRHGGGSVWFGSSRSWFGLRQRIRLCRRSSFDWSGGRRCSAGIQRCLPLSQRAPGSGSLRGGGLRSRRSWCVLSTSIATGTASTGPAISAVRIGRGIARFDGRAKRDGCACGGDDDPFGALFRTRGSGRGLAAFARRRRWNIAIPHWTPGGRLSSSWSGALVRRGGGWSDWLALRPAAVVTDILESIFLGDGRTVIVVVARVVVGVGGDLVLRAVAELDDLAEEAAVLVLHLVPVLARAERRAAEAVERLESGLLLGGLACGGSGRLFLLLLLCSRSFGGGGEVGERAASGGGRGVGREAGLDAGPGRSAYTGGAGSAQRRAERGIAKARTRSALSGTTFQPSGTGSWRVSSHADEARRSGGA